MTEETWHAARLIPTSGISGAEEQERRATSAVLAVMSAVKEFSRALLTTVGAPAGNVETFIEVPFKLGDKEVRPDGLIRVKRGSRSWTALVEVKTGKNDLIGEQLESYLDVARDQGFDALVTISNEISASASQHPTQVDRRKLRKVALHHWSWSRLLSIAVIQKEHRGISDPEQAWILGELIRYLEHPKSGALDFDDMGPDWVALREAVQSATLRTTDKTIPGVTTRFDALLRYAALHLGRRLGTDVTHHLTRRQQADPTLRSAELADSLVDTGCLTGAIRIPDTVGAIHVTADLRSGRVTFHVDVDAPKTGRPTTRVGWVVRQLKHAPGSTRVEAFAAGQRGAGAAELLEDVRHDSSVLVLDPKRDLRMFRVAVAVPMGTKRGRGRGAFIDSVVNGLDAFYEDVVQHLKAWSASPPKVRQPEPPPEDVPSVLVSTSLSSQDGVETVDDHPLGDHFAAEPSLSDRGPESPAATPSGEVRRNSRGE